MKEEETFSCSTSEELAMPTAVTVFPALEMVPEADPLAIDPLYDNATLNLKPAVKTEVKIKKMAQSDEEEEHQNSTLDNPTVFIESVLPPEQEIGHESQLNEEEHQNSTLDNPTVFVESVLPPEQEIGHESQLNEEDPLAGVPDRSTNSVKIKQQSDVKEENSGDSQVNHNAEPSLATESEQTSPTSLLQTTMQLDTFLHGDASGSTSLENISSGRPTRRSAAIALATIHRSRLISSDSDSSVTSEIISDSEDENYEIENDTTESEEENSGKRLEYMSKSSVTCDQKKQSHNGLSSMNNLLANSSDSPKRRMTYAEKIAYYSRPLDTDVLSTNFSDMYKQTKCSLSSSKDIQTQTTKTVQQGLAQLSSVSDNVPADNAKEPSLKRIKNGSDGLEGDLSLSDSVNNDTTQRQHSKNHARELKESCKDLLNESNDYTIAASEQSDNCSNETSDVQTNPELLGVKENSKIQQRKQFGLQEQNRLDFHKNLEVQREKEHNNEQIKIQPYAKNNLKNQYPTKEKFMSRVLSTQIRGKCSIDHRLIKCDVCGEMCDKDILMSHMITHSLQPMHQCKVCDKIFVTESVLRRHLVCVHIQHTHKDRITYAEKIAYYSRPLDADTFNAKFSGIYKQSKCSLPFPQNELTKTTKSVQQVLTQLSTVSNKMPAVSGKEPSSKRIRSSNGFKGDLSLKCNPHSDSVNNITKYTQHYKNPGRELKESCKDLLDDSDLSTISDSDQSDNCSNKISDFDEQRNLKLLVKENRKMQQRKQFGSEERNRPDNEWFESKMSICDEKNKNGRNKWKCLECGKIFYGRKSVQTHLQTVHSDFRPHSCKECGKTFKTQDNLKSHMKVHSNERNYDCEVCGKTFKFSGPCIRHTKKCKGLPPELIKCDVCDKICTKEAIKRHMTIHSVDEHLVQCHICDKSFRGKTKLKTHQRVHEKVTKFMCDICGKACNSPSVLKDHIATHRGVKSYICHVCGKGFGRSHSFHQHIRIHSEKTYKCDICGFACHRLENLATHIRSHTGEKPYSCPLCERTFARHDNMISHKRRVHKIEKVSKNVLFSK